MQAAQRREALQRVADANGVRLVVVGADSHAKRAVTHPESGQPARGARCRWHHINDRAFWRAHFDGAEQSLVTRNLRVKHGADGCVRNGFAKRQRRVDGVGQLQFHFRTGECAKTIAVELPFSNPLTHDFSLTEHYYIVAENPVRYEPDVAGALDGSQPALGPSFVASEDRPGLLALVPRDGSEPIVLDAGDASIVFHYAHAWEEGSRIKVAACAFDRYELGAEYGFDAGAGAEKNIEGFTKNPTEITRVNTRQHHERLTHLTTST